MKHGAKTRVVTGAKGNRSRRMRGETFADYLKAKNRRLEEKVRQLEREAVKSPPSDRRSE